MTEQITQRSHPSPINRHNPATIRFKRHRGKTNFQAKFINWSCLSRGSVPRSQMKTKIDIINLEKNQIHDGTQVKNENGADHPPRKSVVPSPEMENIARYSPKKKSANLKPEYSV